METLLIEKIIIDKNARRIMNPDRLAELTENIKKVGVLEPILVRVAYKGHTLIAGHRRLAAAKAAGLNQIPVRILEVDEKQAQEIQALENLHREDLGPVDEARSFKALLDLGTHTVESLAARVDKSETYVYRALRLLELPEKALNAMDDGILSTGHAQQLLRVPSERHEALIKFVFTKDWKGRYRTVDDLKDEIDRTISKSLTKAPFPTNVEYAGAVACTGCPFNSGNQGMLFDGAEKGDCTNGACYAKKTKEYDKELKTLGEKKYPGLEFVGSAVDRGWGDRAIGRALIVQKVDAKIKEAMKNTPEKFGFGILRPDSYRGGKPQLAIVCKDREIMGIKPEAPASPRLSPEEQERQNYIAGACARAGWEAVLSQIPVTVEALADLINDYADNAYGDADAILCAAGINADEDLAKQLNKRTPEGLLKIMICIHLNDLGMAAKRSGVKLAPITKAAEKTAKAEWEAQKKNAERSK